MQVFLIFNFFVSLNILRVHASSFFYFIENSRIYVYFQKE